MAWCLKPELSTLSFLSDGIGISRYRGSVLPCCSGWPSDPAGYELSHLVGHGSSAVVYKARCCSQQTTVAVKKLDLDGVRHCDLTALIREAALLRRFQHRHVLLLHTSFVVGRELWMVFPYMDLGSVRHIMRQAYPQGMDEVLIATIMRSTLQALDYVHRNGGIHRDIKADNILVNSSGEVRLADFGVASDPSSTISFILDRICECRSSSSSGSSDGGCSGSSDGGCSGSNGSPCHASNSRGSSRKEQVKQGKEEEEDGECSAAALRASLWALRANTVVGTPCWMAPEVLCQAEDGYNNAADVWSLGITLIELATSKPPLARCNPVRVMCNVVNDPPPCLPPDSSSRRYSKALRDLVATCLQKDPSKRPTAAELLQHRFFKSARDAAYLATTLKAALAAAKQQQNQHCAAGAAFGRAASLPTQLPSVTTGNSMTASASGPGSRQVRSEPLMSRIKSVLGLGPGFTSLGLGVGSFLLGPRASRLSLTTATTTAAAAAGRSASARQCSSSGPSGISSIRERSSKRQFTAAAAAMGVAAGVNGSKQRWGGGSGLSSSASTSSPPSQMAAAAAGRHVPHSCTPSASAAGSLSRRGSPGIKNTRRVPVSPAEAARCSWYAK